MSRSLYTDALVETARELSESEFVARTPGLFLVTAENPEDLPSGFGTEVVDFTVASARRLGRRFEVLPISKSDKNPFSDRISVGRARNCDLVIRHLSVSKLHAHFRQTGTGLELIDARSKNGTRVNAVALSPGAPRRIELNDTIHFGTVHAVLVDAVALHEMLR